MRFDIASTLGFGMNLARKHIKIEPDRWYYWADKLGLLVWQDMPSGGNDTPEARKNFAGEWQRLIDARYNHPSIVMWVPFNEGWGQPDAAGTREVAEWTAKYDPTRLVNNTSGWADAGAGHVTDVHQYPGPSMPALERNRAAVLGEFGGLGLPTRGHTWQDEKNWGYVSFKSPAELQQAYQDRLAQLRLLVARGLSAAIYTQTTDVEIETNGLMTYDREVVKIPQATLAAIHRTLYTDLPLVTTVLPTSELDGRTWRYITRRTRRVVAGAGVRRQGVAERARRRSAAASRKACLPARPGRRRKYGCARPSSGPAEASKAFTSSSRTTKTPRSSSTASKRRACPGTRRAT